MSQVDIPIWAQIIISILLLISAAFTVLAALGTARFDSYFQRMHPTGIVTTLGSWCICGAVLIFFSIIEHLPAMYALLITFLLAITLPVSTVTLSRTVLFRKRQSGQPAPPALSYTIVLGDFAPIPEKEQPEKQAESDI